MERKLRELVDQLFENRIRRMLALILAIVVTFTTTYTLVLPAISLEKDTAETMSGVSMGGNDQNGDTVAFEAETKNEDGRTEALVHVEADADAFPAGTTMEAKAVTDQNVIDRITESAEGEVVAVHAVDLKFTDDNGETVQPAEDSQVSVTLSVGEGERSDTQKEVNTEENAPDGQETETTVVQYTENNGAEPVETHDDVSFQVEPESGLDQDSAVSFDMSEQTGDEDSRTYAVVEIVPEDAEAEDEGTPEAGEGASVGGGAAEEEMAGGQQLPPEDLPDEAEESVLTARDESYLVTVTYGPEAKIPGEAALQVEEILSEEPAYEEHLDATQNALNEAAQTGTEEASGIYAGPAVEEEPQFVSLQSLTADAGAPDDSEPEQAPAPEPEIVYARFFDITIVDAGGNEVTPAAPVKVSIELLDAAQDEEVIQNADATPQVIHFAEEKPELMQAEVIEDAAAGVTFDAEGFSVYGVVYTVDFHFGDYAYSILGGGSITVRELFEALDIENDANAVEEAVFSDPSLVWVGKVKEDTTIGALKEANGLNAKYSEDLTEELLAELNARTVEAGEWVLISLKPFDTEETLTVRMADGKVWTIKVTDAQISGLFISDSGETWEITVIYDEDAGIPDGAELEVTEITPDDPEYETYLTRAREELSLAQTDAPEEAAPAEADGENGEEDARSAEEGEAPAASEEVEAAASEEGEPAAASEESEPAAASEESEPAAASEESEPAAVSEGGLTVSLPLVEAEPVRDISFARFFDIHIVFEGKTVEPKAPVTVKVECKGMPALDESAETKAVHFAKSGVELIDADVKGQNKAFVFEQSSFSVTGTVVTSNQNWNNLSSGNKYVMYTYSDGKYYAIRHDRSLTEVTVENRKLTFENLTSMSGLDAYLWDYEAVTNSIFMYTWTDHFLSYQTGGTRYYIDPQAANDISATRRNLERNAQGRIHSGNNYLGISGGNIVGQQNNDHSVEIQFANAFELDVERYVTVHFVDRTGTPLTGVNYTGGNAAVTPNGDGTYKILYNWHGGTGSVHLDTDFSKAGYTYANSHLAGTRQGTALTYDGLVIDAELKEVGRTLHYFTDNGDENNGNGGNAKFGALQERDLNGAQQVYYTNTNGSAVLGDYSPANAESKDIYVILDPTRAGTGGGSGSGPGSGPGSAGGDIDVNDPDFNKTMEPNGDGTYTISLSVTGKAKNQTVNPKANVVLVVDTSSSMDNPRGAANSRLNVTKAALSGENGISTGLFANNGANGRPADTVEVAMITFDGSVVTSDDWMTTKAAFDQKVNNLTEASLHRGTDWEDALKEAYTLASAKMSSQPEEATFIIFFTDGEPSQYTQFHGAGDYNENNPNNNESGYRVWYSYFLSREAAKDEARTIVNAGIRLYSIFAFNNNSATYNGESGSDLLKNTIGYAYNMSTVPDNTYFYNAGDQSALVSAFDKILKSINESIGVSNVHMHDDITGLTSVGISVDNTQFKGFKYTRSGGRYGTGQEWEEAPSARFVENTNSTDPANSEKYVEWDIGAASTLEDGVTYTVSFTVWPSQDAYDLVADLNNGLKTWNNLTEGEKKQVEENPAGSGKYELRTNPPSAEGNNKITYDKVLTEILDELPPGVEVGKEYNEGNVTTVYTANDDGTYTATITTHKETAFNDPLKRMELKDTISKVTKKWISDLQLRQLVEYLYDTETGESREVKIPFILNKDENIYGNVIWLGWDQEGTGTGYTWADTTQSVTVGDNNYTIGTEWTRQFNIAVGLALDEDHAEERNIDLTDTTKYTKVLYNGEELYVLETGHDYYINEPAVAALLGYRFDFETRIYHPMLLNGVLKSVTIENGVVKDVYPGGTQALGALVGENTLRGGINLHKILWDDKGNPIPPETQVDDEFEFTITLVNTGTVQEKVLVGTEFVEQPPHYVFVGEDIPWYSVNGNYYHDDEGNYYSEGGEGRSGNIMTTSDGQTATVTLKIKRTDTVRIANVPAGTTFTIVETPRDDYDFVSASRGVSGTAVYNLTVNAPKPPSIGGEIVPNKEMNVAFTNQKVVKYHIYILKKDSVSGEVLQGAVFDLYGKDYYVMDGQGQPTATVNAEAEPKLTGLTSGEDGKLDLGELASGTYYLVETQAPAGYLQTTPIRIRVDRNSTLTNQQGKPLFVTYHQDGYSGSDDYTGIEVTEALEQMSDGTAVTTYSYTLTAVNNPGFSLPSTGGPGTVHLTLLGSVLTAGACLLLWRKQKQI